MPFQQCLKRCSPPRNPKLDTARRAFEKRNPATCLSCHRKGHVATECPNVSNVDETLELLRQYIFDAPFNAKHCMFLRDSGVTMKVAQPSFVYSDTVTVVPALTHSNLNKVSSYLLYDLAQLDIFTFAWWSVVDFSGMWIPIGSWNFCWASDSRSSREFRNSDFRFAFELNRFLSLSDASFSYLDLE